MQNLWEVLSNSSCSIRLQSFDFEVNINADKWANIFKIPWKLRYIKWNDLCVLII